MTRTLPRFILPIQAVLLIIELGSRYDTLIRQCALAVTDVVGTAFLFIVARRFVKSGQPLPWVVSWLAVTGIWFDAAGNFAKLYGTIVWWDKLAHFVGTAALAGGLWLAVRAYQQRLGGRWTAAFLGLIAVSFSILLSVLYEISEYLGDLVFSTRRVTDLFDTSDDLLWNLLAAVIVVILFTWYYARRANIDPPRSSPVQ